MAVCSRCGVELTNENWTPSRQKKKSYYCTGCVRDYNKKWKRLHPHPDRRQYKRQWRAVYKADQKARAVEYLGGRCSDCGLWDEDVAIYDFHHIDPSTKRIGISYALCTRKWEDIQDELDKCVLLCANCHRKRHSTEELD